jgi:hypothetical protein
MLDKARTISFVSVSAVLLAPGSIYGGWSRCDEDLSDNRRDSFRDWPELQRLARKVTTLGRMVEQYPEVWRRKFR